MIGTNEKRESRKSMHAARLDDDDDDICNMMHISIFRFSCFLRFGQPLG